MMESSAVFFAHPMDERIVALLAVNALVLVITTGKCIQLLRRQLTFLHAAEGYPAAKVRALRGLRVLIVCPMSTFALLTTLMFLELDPYFMLAREIVAYILVSASFDYFISGYGGEEHVKAMIRRRAASPTASKVDFRSVFPCCCLKRCSPPKVPQVEDLEIMRSRLSLSSAGWVVIGVIQWLLEVCGRGIIAPEHAWFLCCVFFPMASVPFVFYYCSSLRGLYDLLESVNDSELSVPCSPWAYMCFAAGFHVFPIFLPKLYAVWFGSLELRSGEVVSDIQLFHFARCVSWPFVTAVVQMSAGMGGKWNSSYPELSQAASRPLLDAEGGGDVGGPAAARSAKGAAAAPALESLGRPLAAPALASTPPAKKAKSAFCCGRRAPRPVFPPAPGFRTDA